MSTITTKQLRENMAQVISDLRKGESIQLSYRHKIIGVLQPAPLTPLPLRRGTQEAISRGLEALQDIHIPEEVRNDRRNMKERLSELRYEKYSK